MKIHSPAGAGNFDRLIDALLEESGGRITLDIDVTAALRPGYFGCVRGNVFVENRYTDWRRYYPHATLRNLWQLAAHVDPVRLRMEFLNNARNAALYGDDPLAPGRYAPEYLFAGVMIASPLAWLETSSLPAEYVRRVAPLIATWKLHRRRLHSGTIIPIGESPDGTGWTGFASLHADGSADVLAFRERSDRAEATFTLARRGDDLTAARIAGEGAASLSGDALTVRIPSPQRFVWVRIKIPKHAS